MAGGRTLTVTLVANTKNFAAGMRDAVRNAEGFKGKMNAVSSGLNTMAGPAMLGAAAAAGALALKLGVDGVKAAVADQAAADKLTQTLRNLGLAHDNVKIEDFIFKLQMQTGTVDDELRPAMERLIRSTENTSEAQRALQLALDISASKGKDLGLVANSLGKAYDGNANALGRLGLGIDSAILKSGDMGAITSELSRLFSGQAAAAANTWSGRLQRLNVAFDELKESFGAGFLAEMDNAEQGTASLTESIAALRPIAEDVGRNIGEITNALAALGSIVGNVQSVTDGFPDWMKRIGDYANRVLNPVGSLVENLAIYADYQANAARVEQMRAEQEDRATARILNTSKATRLLGADTSDTTDVMSVAVYTTETYSNAMASVATNARITASRLGAVSDAIADVDAAVSHYEALQNYRQAIKDFVAEPTQQGLVDIVSAANDAAVSFDDPTKAAKFYNDAIEKTGKLAQDNKLKIPESVAQSAQNAADAMSNTRLSAELLKREMESIPTLISSQVRMDVLVNGQYYDPYGGYGRTNKATGGQVYATGGMVRAALGTHASDSVAAMLSRGEYVLNADTVRRVGVGALNRMNNGGAMSGQGFVIENINVAAAPGERAEESVPRALRRMAFLVGQ